MNEQIRAIISAYITSYESTKRMIGEENIPGLNAVYNELLEIAEKNPDTDRFSQAASDSGVFNRFSIETKKAMEYWGRQQSDIRTHKEVTIGDLRRQIERIFIGAESNPYMFYLKEVYKKYRDSAYKAGDTYELATIAEKECIPLELSKAPLYDNNKLDLDRTDPNETTIVKFRSDICRLAKGSNSVDELTYNIELAVNIFKQEISREQFIDYLLTLFMNRMLSYNIILSNIRKGAYLKMPDMIGSMMILIKEIKNIYNSLKDDFSADIFNLSKRHQKRLLVQSFVIPGTDRVFSSMDPANIEWIKETLSEEVLSGKTATQILSRKPDRVFNPVPESNNEISVSLPDKLKDAAFEKIKDFYWAQK